MEPGTGLKPDGPGAVNRDRGQAREPTGARTHPMNHPAPTPALRFATRNPQPACGIPHPRLQPGFFAKKPRPDTPQATQNQPPHPAPPSAGTPPTAPLQPLRPLATAPQPHRKTAPLRGTSPPHPAPCARQRNGSPRHTPHRPAPEPLHPRPSSRSCPASPSPIHRPLLHRGTTLRRTPCHTAPAPLQPLNPLATAPQPHRETAPLRGTSPPPQHPRDATPSRATFSVHEKEP